MNFTGQHQGHQSLHPTPVADPGGGPPPLARKTGYKKGNVNFTFKKKKRRRPLAKESKTRNKGEGLGKK